VRYSYNRLSDRYPSHHRRHPLALFLRGLDITSALVTTMHRNDYVMITAHNPGWFTLDLNVASPSMDKLGYLEETRLGGFNGPCSL
jgi:hypothetical protein